MKKTAVKILIALLLVATFVVTTFSYAGEPYGADQTLFKEGCYATYFDGYATLFGYYFGGAIEVTVLVYHESFTLSNNAEVNPAVSVMTQINQYLEDINAVANSHEEGSDVYNFNNANVGDVISISDHTASMVQTAKAVYLATNGAYNPAVYRLVDLWGFSSRTYMRKNLGVEYGGERYDRNWYMNDDYTYSYPLPEEKYITAFKQLCDFDSVVLSGESGSYTLTKTCADVVVDGVSYGQMLDFGGVAKGYACDVVNAYLTQLGITKGYINCGYSSYYLLTNATGDDFEIRLQNPTNLLKHYSKIMVSNSALSTSGQTIRRYTTDGVTYSHIIDASTGYPAQTGIVTTNVIGGTSAMDDCLTTALTVFTPQQVVEFFNSDFVKVNNLKCIAVHKKATGHKVLTNMEQSQFAPLEMGFSFGTSLDQDGNVKAGCNLVITSSSLGFFLFALAGLFARKEDLVFKAQQSKLFSKWDILLYLLLIVLVVVLFAVFVFSPAKGLESVKVVDQLNGQTVFTFDFATNTYSISPQYSNMVTVVPNGDKYTFTIERDRDLGEVWQNVVEISTKQGDQYAKMIDANCPTHDCINLFNPIVQNDQAIVCSPHRLKIVSTTSNQGGIII